MTKRRKTSLNNVKSFVNNANNVKDLTILINLIKDKINVLSGSEKSDSDSNVFTDDIFTDAEDALDRGSNVVLVSGDGVSVHNVPYDGVSGNSVVPDDVDPDKPLVPEVVSCESDVLDIAEVASVEAAEDIISPNVRELDTSYTNTNCFNNYVPGFLSEELSDKALNHFSEYNFRNSENGHKVAAFGEPYHYQGSKQKGTPEEFPEIIQEIVKEIHSKYPMYDISECTVNDYDGNESFLPEHSDDESSIDSESLIFTLSLGQSRTIVFRHKTTNREVNLCLEHGSMYTMSYASQHLWWHRMDRVSLDNNIPIGRRTAITLRCIKRKMMMIEFPRTNVAVVPVVDKEVLVSSEVVVVDKDTVVEDAHAEDVHVEGVPVEEVYVEDAPVEDVPDKDVVQNEDVADVGVVDDVSKRSDRVPEHIVLGDSLVRHVNTNKDSLTIFKGGGRIKDMKALLENAIILHKLDNDNLRNIKSLTLCVGTNNLADNVPLYKIVYEYTELLEYLRHKLPNCRIGLFNVPPRFYNTIDLMIRIKAFNNSLLDLTSFYPVCVLQVFWQLMDSYGYINPSLFKRDALHFSMDGVSLVSSHIFNFQKNRERFNY